MAKIPQHFEERVLLTIPKNSTNETRVIRKHQFISAKKTHYHFIDFREMWFNAGPTEEPLPTRRGTMIHREFIPSLIIALLKEMRDNSECDDEYCDLEWIETCRDQLARLEGLID